MIDNSSLINYQPFSDSLRYNFIQLYLSESFLFFVDKFNISPTDVLLQLYSLLEYNLIYNNDLKLSIDDHYILIQNLYKNLYINKLGNNKLYYDAVLNASNFN